MRAEEAASVGDRVRDVVWSDLPEPTGERAFPDKALWRQVRECGSELWLDTGDIEAAGALWCRQFSAVTTNNTLLNAEVEKGTYDDLIAEVASTLEGAVSQHDMPLEISFVLNARHALRLVKALGARVSVELHTDFADDVECTLAYARRYHQVAPEHFYVKVPLTPAGLLATRRLGGEGVPVNLTLGFSARQNYLAARLAEPAFVNVFLGRLNSVVPDNGLGSGEMVGERATIASQQAVLELRSDRGLRTRQIAASMRDGQQVLSLAGVDVLTMPVKVTQGFEDMAPSDPLNSRVEELPEAGLDEDAARKAGVNCLWDVPEDFKAAVEAFAAQDLARISATEVCSFFRQKGFPGLFPRWSPADAQRASDDGKIPRLAHWREGLTAGEVALDALMNLSGLRHFASSQREMDERVRSLL